MKTELYSDSQSQAPTVLVVLSGLIVSVVSYIIVPAALWTILFGICIGNDYCTTEGMFGAVVAVTYLFYVAVGMLSLRFIAKVSLRMSAEAVLICASIAYIFCSYGMPILQQTELLIPVATVSAAVTIGVFWAVIRMLGILGRRAHIMTVLILLFCWFVCPVLFTGGAI